MYALKEIELYYFDTSALYVSHFSILQPWQPGCFVSIENVIWESNLLKELPTLFAICACVGSQYLHISRKRLC